MNLIPWRRSASTPLVRFRKEMDDLWGRFFDDTNNGWEASQLPEAFTRGGVPSLNISENEEALTFTLDLPGVEKEDVNVEVMGDELVISGERKWESKKEEKDFLRMESQFGAFRRVIPLPTGLRTEPDEIEARFKNGTLEVHLKKVEPTPSKKVAVQSS